MGGRFTAFNALSGHLESFLNISGSAVCKDREPGIDEDNISLCVRRCACKNGSGNGCILFCRTADDRFLRCFFKAKGFRVNDTFRKNTTFHIGKTGVRSQRYFIHTIFRTDHKGTLHIQFQKGFGHTLYEVRREDTQEVFSCACRVGQRPKYVENGSVLYGLAYRHQVLHHRMVIHRKDKTEPCLFQHLNLFFRAKIEVNTQRLQNIRRTGIGSNAAATVFCYHRTRRSQKQRNRR